MFVNLVKAVAKPMSFAVIATRKRVKSEPIAKHLSKFGKRSAVFMAFLFWKSKEPEDYATEFMAQTITPSDQLKNQTMRSQFELFVMKVQKEVCDQLQVIENKSDNDLEGRNQAVQFKVDRWTRPEGGGGVTCVLEDGQVFEKAGVNISVVYGKLPAAAAQQMRARGKPFKENSELKFFACGVSSVIHPRNPNVPTVHFNYRYFEVNDETNEENHWWFGGGTDMTPYILDETDAVHFHKTLKKACDRHDKQYYPKFKKWCDEYFYINHRQESRLSFQSSYF